MAKLQTPDPETVREQLREMSRDPFQQVLARLLGHAPTDTDLQAFAAKSPDRWAQAVSIFTKAAGYADKQEVQVEDLRDKSDAEIRAELEALRQNQPDSMIGHNSKPTEPDSASD